MKIRKRVIDRIMEQDPKRILAFRQRLGLALGKSDLQVRRYLDENSDNLTKAAALAVIREETGLTDDQILETNSLAEKV